MKLIFFGAPEFSAVVLSSLIDTHEVLAVMTQPDRPAGRGGKIVPGEVKKLAVSAGIPVLQPVKIKNNFFYDALKSYGADIFAVAAFGRILPERLLTLPKYGAVCVHPSMLPKYRGAAPIQRAVMNGEKQTGVSVMQMDPGIDTGDILLRETVEITDNDTYGSLHDRLAVLGARLLTDALGLIEIGEIERVKQNDADATYAAMIDKETGRIDWDKPPAEILNLIRGLYPRPGAYTIYNGEALKIWSAAATDDANGFHGAISVSPAGEIIVAARGGGVVLKEMQAPGAKRMGSAAFQRGRRLPEGDMFGA